MATVLPIWIVSFSIFCRHRHRF